MEGAPWKSKESSLVVGVHPASLPSRQLSLHPTHILCHCSAPPMPTPTPSHAHILLSPLLDTPTGWGPCALTTLICVSSAPDVKDAGGVRVPGAPPQKGAGADA